MLYPGTGVTGGDCALVSGCAFMEGDTYSEQSENIIVFESTGEYISFREYASDIGWGLIPDEKKRRHLVVLRQHPDHDIGRCGANRLLRRGS